MHVYLMVTFPWVRLAKISDQPPSKTGARFLFDLFLLLSLCRRVVINLTAWQAVKSPLANQDVLVCFLQFQYSLEYLKDRLLTLSQVFNLNRHILGASLNIFMVILQLSRCAIPVCLLSNYQLKSFHVGLLLYLHNLGVHQSNRREKGFFHFFVACRNLQSDICLHQLYLRLHQFFNLVDRNFLW